MAISAYEAQKRYRARYPERARARDRICKRLKRGSLKRPACCDRCGAEGEVQAHHPDYSQPLKVEWLCLRCHWGIHGGLSRGEEPPRPLDDEGEGDWFADSQKAIDQRIEERRRRRNGCLGLPASTT